MFSGKSEFLILCSCFCSSWYSYNGCQSRQHTFKKVPNSTYQKLKMPSFSNKHLECIKNIHFAALSKLLEPVFPVPFPFLTNSFSFWLFMLHRQSHLLSDENNSSVFWLRWEYIILKLKIHEWLKAIFENYNILKEGKVWKLELLGFYFLQVPE